MAKCSNYEADNVLTSILTRTDVRLKDETSSPATGASSVSDAARHLPRCFQTIIVERHLQNVSENHLSIVFKLIGE
jgi:hypothetical protein